MTRVAGAVLLLIALLAWAGQAISWLAPARAARLGLAEAEDSVDRVYWADIRGEAAWDTLTLWVLTVAGVLLVVDSSAWAYFGLVGGGMFLYFAGRGIATRREMQRRGIRIGDDASVRVAYVALSVWAATALVTIVAAVEALDR